jgi:hypothetical protein
MSTKSILILYTGDDWELDQPDYSTSQKIAYDLWGEIAAEQGIQLLRAAVTWFHEKEFSKYWQYSSSGWQKVESVVTPTVIYDKSERYDKATGELRYDLVANKIQIDKCIPVLNSPDFSMLLDNKLNQSVIFAEYLPYSRIALAGELISNPQHKKIVIKRFHGSGGKYVQITTAEEIRIEQKSLIQDFIAARSADGVLKDIRLVYLGSTVQYALSRIAMADSDFTNFHQGARIEFLNLADLNWLIDYAKPIAAKLEIFPKRNFSLDFMISVADHEPYLIELNNMPGLDVFDDQSLPQLTAYLTNLTDYLVN